MLPVESAEGTLAITLQQVPSSGSLPSEQRQDLGTSGAELRRGETACVPLLGQSPESGLWVPTDHLLALDSTIPLLFLSKLVQKCKPPSSPAVKQKIHRESGFPELAEDRSIHPSGCGGKTIHIREILEPTPILSDELIHPSCKTETSLL